MERNLGNGIIQQQRENLERNLFFLKGKRFATEGDL